MVPNNVTRMSQPSQDITATAVIRFAAIHALRESLLRNINTQSTSIAHVTSSMAQAIVPVTGSIDGRSNNNLSHNKTKQQTTNQSHNNAQVRTQVPLKDAVVV